MPFSDSAIRTCSSASSQHFTLNLTKYSHFLKALFLQKLDCLNASGFQWNNKAKHCNPLYSKGMPNITPAQLLLQNQKAGESPLYTSPFGISEKLAICTAASHQLGRHSCKAQAAHVTYRLKQGSPVLPLCRDSGGHFHSWNLSGAGTCGHSTCLGLTCLALDVLRHLGFDVPREKYLLRAAESTEQTEHVVHL